MRILRLLKINCQQNHPGSIPGAGKKFIFFSKWAKPGLFLFISFFSHDKYSTNLTINDKSIDGMLGTRTRGGRMVGADKSTELWRDPQVKSLSAKNKRVVNLDLSLGVDDIREGKIAPITKIILQ